MSCVENLPQIHVPMTARASRDRDIDNFNYAGILPVCQPLITILASWHIFLMSLPQRGVNELAYHKCVP